MSSAEFSWQSLLHTDAPSMSSLKGALFTTYDRADERLIAEDLLPLLLKLGREPESEGAERQYFLLELDQRLKHLHDHLIVVSSTAREEPADAEEGESGTYGWIWRSIRHLTVGIHGKAVQHAKLWLLHWGPIDAGGVEYLEVVVSSANLTRAAFRGQLQAAWRACIELRPQRSEERLHRWAVLPDFLRELAASAGEDGLLDSFIELLARGDCPQGVRFVASVPGNHSRQVLRHTPWGAAGLREITPSGQGAVRVGVLSPFVGSWSATALRRWCDAFEGAPDRLTLVWIEKNHPWARNEKWILPEGTLNTLTELDATLGNLRHEPDDSAETNLFHEEYRPTHDDRWSHAKLYSFSRGISRRLLVTSANFSPAAWGRQNDAGQLTIENFELGVCVEQAAWPFDDLQPFDSVHEAATVSELPTRGSTLILWARALWNGKQVDVSCRCEMEADLKGKINSGSDRTPITKWTLDGDRNLCSAHVPWADSHQPPLSVQLTCGEQSMSVAVFDARPARDREATLPPEVDEDTAQIMRDELLFEQYGGRVAADIEDETSIECGAEPSEDDSGEEAKSSDNYSVPAFVLARQHLGVVDYWADGVNRAAASATGEFELRLLQRDGELLIEAFQRQAERDSKQGSAWAIGAKLASEELALRLKYFPES